MIPYTWTRIEMEWETEQCPPDLTFSMTRPQPWASTCRVAHKAGYTCTRRQDHGGRHAAGTGDYITAVWP